MERFLDFWKMVWNSFQSFGHWCAGVWWKCLKKPMITVFFLHWFWVLLLVIVSAVLLFYAFAIPEANPFLCYIGYGISAYTLTLVCIRIPKLVRGVKRGLYKNKYSNRLLTDTKFRTEFSLYLGCGISICYAVFKFTAGVYYRSVWFGALAVYYLILCVMKLALMKRYRRNLIYEDAQEQRRFGLKSYRFCGILMFVLNIAISGLVIQLIWQGQTYEYPGYLIYVMAMYAFYCIGMAVRNMAKHRKLETPILAATKMLSFSCALVSLLALQTAMLTQFGEGQENFAGLMNSLTGGAVCLLIFGLAVWMVRRADRELCK